MSIIENVFLKCACRLGLEDYLDLFRVGSHIL